MILLGKLNQTCIWKKKLENDHYGDGIFEDGIEISCRIEGGNRLVFDENYKEIIGISKYFVNENVSVGDLIDNRHVISISKMTSVFGSGQGLEALCK